MKHFSNLQKSNSDLFTLSYDKDLRKVSWKSHSFYPNSSWAEGRNLLLEIAIQARIEYDYFVFLDDDVEFLQGSFHQFEERLNFYQPDYAVPLCDEIRTSNRAIVNVAVQHPCATDQQMQAFSKKAILEGKVLPFETKFDAYSWWYSGEINNSLTLSFLRGRCAQFNDIVVTNQKHIWATNDLGPSHYKFGKDKELLKACRKYLLFKHGQRPLIVNTLFFPTFLPELRYLPTYRSLFNKFRIEKKIKSFVRIVTIKFLNEVYRTSIRIFLPNSIIKPNEFKSY